VDEYAREDDVRADDSSARLEDLQRQLREVAEEAKVLRRELRAKPSDRGAVKARLAELATEEQFLGRDVEDLRLAMASPGLARPARTKLQIGWGRAKVPFDPEGLIQSLEPGERVKKVHQLNRFLSRMIPLDKVIEFAREIEPWWGLADELEVGCILRDRQTGKCVQGAEMAEAFLRQFGGTPVDVPQMHDGWASLPESGQDALRSNI
jgi:hypothetical protein